MRPGAEAKARPRPVEPGNELASEPPPSHPIPLVVRSLPPAEKRPRGLGGTDPGVGRAPRLDIIQGQDEEGEPIIGLFRSKPPPPPSSASVPEIIVPVSAHAADLETAESADEVLGLLARLATPLGRSAIVFAVRPNAYAARTWSSNLADMMQPHPPRIPISRYGVIDAAFSDGHFLGRIPEDTANEALTRLLGNVEVYVVPVLISDRAACALVLSELHSTFEDTRSADELARLAGLALERIVRERKRGT